MKISYNWLKNFIKTDLPLTEVTAILTDIGLEVEGTHTTGISEADLENFVVGEVLTCQKHPNADKLSLTTVDLGNGEVKQIVCGAPNVAKGQKVPVAKIGAKIKDGKGGSFEIKKAKLRGEESNGMICSKKELRLSEDHSGIWEMDAALIPGTPISEVIENSEDTMIEIGLTPNRSDAMSHFGVARDLFAALQSRNIPVEKTALNFAEIAENDIPNPISVEIEDYENCPRYAGVSMKNVQVKPSPIWLQNVLKTIGLSPKNNIVDITNYILHGFGQPMHAFDASKIAGNKIIVKSGDFKDFTFVTLDKAERKLSGNELLICDTEKPIAIGGVMGGLDSSVTENTTEIFLESAYFKPVSVRKTSKFHGINSDSSFRFERGIDPDFTINALKIAVQMIQDLTGGEVVGKVIDEYPDKIKNHIATYNFEKANKLIGYSLEKEKIKDILHLLEIKILAENQDELQLEIPAYRVDVQRQADLIEEILRIYGFNEIPNPEKMALALVPGEGFIEDDIEQKLAETLVLHGFNEAMNLSMHKKEYNDWLNFDNEKNIEILNSLSGDLAEMRRSLLPGLLENVDFNLKRKKENIKLFELGNSYHKISDGFQENRMLSMIVCGNQTEENWQIKSERVNISWFKGVLDQIFKKFGFSDISVSEYHSNFDAYGIKFNAGNLDIAHLYNIPQKILKKFDIDVQVIFAEINLTEFKNYVKQHKGTKFREISAYPEVRRDLALLLDKDKMYSEVEKIVKNSDTTLIKKVNLFDVYEGDKLPDSKKSYAISIHLQDKDKTMNDKQIDAIMNKIIRNLEKEIQAELRK